MKADPIKYGYFALLLVVFFLGGYLGITFNLNRSIIREIVNDDEGQFYWGVMDIENELIKDDSERLGMAVITMEAVYVVRNINNNFDIAAGIFEKSTGKVVDGYGFENLSNE